MSVAVASAVEKPALPPVAEGREWTRFRLIPRIEAEPKVVQFAQTAAGKLSLLAIFGATLSLVDGEWLSKLGLVSLITFLPRLRRPLVLVGTLFFTKPFWYENGVLSGVAAVSHTRQVASIILPFVALCAGLMWFVHKHQKSFLARRSLVCLLGIYAATLAVACYAPLDHVWRFTFWAFLLVFSNYFWFLAYAISDAAAPAGDGVAYQFGTFHPFWGSTTVPLPKGSGYWRRIEAKTPEELAVTMIKGGKLIVWCYLLSVVNHYYPLLVYQKLRIPTMDECLTAFSAGHPLSMPMNWLSLPSDFLQGILWLAVWGHMVIATCRMAGFRALRNTYAPLSSRTIAEYWNRYYYYFKELLVDMFFYPTFIRCFKRSPRLRIFFATFVAASLGNMLFHFMRDIHHVWSWGLMRCVAGFQLYGFYSVILALGIAISQVRSRKGDARGWFRTRILAPACVFSFFCLVHVFDSTSFGSPALGIRYIVHMFSGGLIT